MCERLYKNYPEDSPDMIKKYFPNNVKVENGEKYERYSRL